MQNPFVKAQEWLTRNGFTLLDVTRWALALNLSKLGFDHLVLSPWFGRWEGGFWSIQDGLAEPYAWPRWALYLLPGFWPLSSWILPLAVTLSGLAMIAASLKKWKYEPHLQVFSAYLGYSLYLRNVFLGSQGDLWLIFSILLLGLAGRGPSLWAGVWRLQAFCVYFWAGVNKWFTPAWHNGDAVYDSLFTPFVAHPQAEILSHLPQWAYLALAFVTMGQRIFTSWALALPDDPEDRRPGLLRKLSVVGFFGMHTGYWLLLSVGTFSTVGWACAPGLFEDPAQQIGEWKGLQTLRKQWVATIAAVLVLIASPLHFLSAFEPFYEVAPRWDMFVGSSKSHPIIKYELWYGNDTKSYQPLLKFLSKDGYAQLPENVFEWNKFMWNWRLRLWLLTITDCGQNELLLKRFKETLATEFALEGAGPPTRELLSHPDMGVLKRY